MGSVAGSKGGCRLDKEELRDKRKNSKTLELTVRGIRPVPGLVMPIVTEVFFDSNVDFPTKQEGIKHPRVVEEEGLDPKSYFEPPVYVVGGSCEYRYKAILEQNDDFEEVAKKLALTFGYKYGDIRSSPGGGDVFKI